MLKTYDLHKDDDSKLHFELRDARPYYERNEVHATVPHRHSFYQVIWFREAGSHFIDYEIQQHPARTLFFINKQQVHYFCPYSANQGYLFHFNDRFIERYAPGLMDQLDYSIFNELHHNFVVLSEAEASQFETLSGYILEEQADQALFYQKRIFHCLQLILLLIERRRKQEGHLPNLNDPDFTIALAFKKMVFQHLDQFLNIDAYAHALNTHPKTLTRASKSFLMDTPANVVKKMKVLEAKRMLSNQKTSIKEIAYDLGFDQATYFTKYFKKETGMTPKEFQQQLL